MFSAETQKLFPVLCRNIERTRRVALDTEARAPEGMPASTAKNARLAIPSLFSASSDNHSQVIQVDDAGRRFVKEILTNPLLTARIHNTLYDVVLWHTQGIVDEAEIRARIADGMILQFLLNEEAEKGLKEMAWQHMRVRMKTFDEVTEDHPNNLKIDDLNAEIAALQRAIKKFPKERPWPDFDSPATKNIADLRRRIKEETARRWPGTRSATGRVSYSAEERQARKEFQDAQEAVLDHYFGDLAHTSFEAWAENQQIAPKRRAIAKLRKKIEDDFVDYAENDTRQEDNLWDKLEPIVRQGTEENPPLDYWLDIEIKVREITTKASCRGVPIDIARLRTLGDVLDPLIAEFNNEIREMSLGYTSPKGEEFNPNSPAQLCDLLFRQLGVTPPEYRRLYDGRILPKFTPAGEIAIKKLEEAGHWVDLNDLMSITDEVKKYLSCDSEVLERVDHPIGMAILNLRVVEKLKGTYVEGAVEKVLSQGKGRLRTLLNSLGTATGRLSSSGPNLQNIPSRKKPEFYDDRVLGLGPTIREAFVAERGKKLLVADQSQVELRLIAAETRDPVMLSIYEAFIEIDGVKHYIGDIHRETSKRHNIQRKLAKNVNFGFNYGMKPLRFARQIRLFVPGTKQYDIARATELRNQFFSTYSGVEAALMDFENAWAEGICNYRMVTGRLRHFEPGSYVTGGKILNAKIQGSSADIIKLNMVIIDEFVRPLVPSLEFILQVHDELLYQADEHEAALAAILIKYVMEFSWFPWISVPILASAKICDTWAAKDDDDVPEVGVYYARIGDQDRVFDAASWPEYRAIEKSGVKIEVKGATASLSAADRLRCETLLNPETIRRSLRLPDQPIQ